VRCLVQIEGRSEHDVHAVIEEYLNWQLGPETESYYSVICMSMERHIKEPSSSLNSNSNSTPSSNANNEPLEEKISVSEVEALVIAYAFGLPKTISSIPEKAALVDHALAR
jgi:hypothetical protein